MGIKGLSKVIKKFASRSKKVVKLSKYSGKRVSIDTSIFLYRYTYSLGNPVKGFINQIIALTKHNIEPLYVFDGKPPVEKNALIKRRKDIYKTRNEKIVDLENDKEILLEYYENNKELDSIINSPPSTVKRIVSSYYSDISNDNINNGNISNDDIGDDGKRNFSSSSLMGKIMFKNPNEILDVVNDITDKINRKKKNNIYITRKSIENCKRLFELFGIAYIVADGEAENLCSQLSYSGIVDGCISEDMDVLPNGGKKLLRNYASYKKEIEEYDLDIILEDLQLTHDEFIDLCILCECDYTNKITIRGIGPLTALKLIRKDKNIETILDKIDNKVKGYRRYVNPGEPFNYKEARKIFKNSCQIIPDKKEFMNTYKMKKIESPNGIKNLISFINNDCNINLSYKLLNAIREKYPIYQDNIINTNNTMNNENHDGNDSSNNRNGSKYNNSPIKNSNLCRC